MLYVKTDKDKVKIKKKTFIPYISKLTETCITLQLISFLPDFYFNLIKII